MAVARVDPVTQAVVRNALVGATQKAFVAFRRTAMIPILYEGSDFAFSLYDDRLNLVAEAAAVPLFAGALGDTVPRLLQAIGRQRLRPQDILLTNLPHLNGSHPPDGVLVDPVFHDERLVAFFALRAHMGDLGGTGFGADVFQEGLQLPPLKLYDAGSINQTVVDIIRANSREPVATAGDFIAGAGALRTGSAALRAAIDRYGLDTYYATVDAILDHGERVARQSIARIPDGDYHASGAMDDNGILRGVPVPVEVTVRVRGSDLTVDTTGSAPEQKGPINCPWPYTQAVCRMALKTLATSGIPSNSGEHRVLTVVAPPGSLYNPGPAAASFLSSRPTIHLVELILTALAPALPGELPAMSGGDVAGVTYRLKSLRSGRYTINASIVLGSGFGARAGADGPSAIYARQAAGLQLVSGEVLETRAPVIRVRCELDQDSGGPGRWRGGLGMIEEEEYLSEGTGGASSDRTSGASPVLGLAGGLPPRRLNGVIHYYGSDHELGPPSCKRAGLPLKPGDRHLAWTAGGGGYGDPRQRDPAAVASDVKNGYISEEAAREVYGVDVARTLVATRASGSATANTPAMKRKPAPPPPRT
jgi:N-methylhydantoinase B